MSFNCKTQVLFFEQLKTHSQIKVPCFIFLLPFLESHFAHSAKCGQEELGASCWKLFQQLFDRSSMNGTHYRHLLISQSPNFLYNYQLVSFLMMMMTTRTTIGTMNTMSCLWWIGLLAMDTCTVGKKINEFKNVNKRP